MSSMFSEPVNPVAAGLMGHGILGGPQNPQRTTLAAAHHGLLSIASIIHSLVAGGHLPPQMEGGHTGFGGRVDPGAGGPNGLPEIGPGGPAPVPAPPPGVAPPPAGSYNPAQYYRATGNPTYAAELWQSHHPAAMAGDAPIPDWVRQALAAALRAHTPAHPMAPPPSSQYQ